jgi:aminobenzoyl-glutamate transport protein
MLGNLAADAAYVVLIPLAGIIFHAAGRHPIAGIAAAFAGVSAVSRRIYSPGQLDALLFGITEASVETVFGDFTANIAGNWFFIAGMTFVFLPVIWYVTDKIIEPGLGAFDPSLAAAASAEDESDRELTDDERKGLRYAGWAVLFVIGLWTLFTIGPGTPLIDEAASAEAQMAPFYKSLGGRILYSLSALGLGLRKRRRHHQRPPRSGENDDRGRWKTWLTIWCWRLPRRTLWPCFRGPT